MYDRIFFSKQRKYQQHLSPKMIDWSQLPEDLLRMIAVRSFSVVEFKRFRSICRSWRSSSADENPFPLRPITHLNPLVVTVSAPRGNIEQIYGLDLGASLSRAAFFRVTLSSSSSSSSSSQGWLMKSDSDLGSGKFHLLNPLSRLPLQSLSLKQSIDLLEFAVSEIGESYVIQNTRKKKEAYGFKKLVLVGEDSGIIVGIGLDGKIRYWNGEIWTRIEEQCADFSDIVVHKGFTYALDSKGIVWWISSSLSIFRYGPSLNENMTSCSEKRLVECCGELYIVDRLLKGNQRKRKVNYVVRFPRLSYAIHDDAGNTLCQVAERKRPKTLGFTVYKMDEESGKWVEVKSLGDNAILLATDCCFSVSANEFYGCLQNSIYFSDDEEELKVFKLDDGSITTMKGFSQSCFQMFVPNFG